ncbi:hypothetical protein J3P75_23015 [Pseudomonas sp. R1-1]|uniref:hypothetical protein n=1 Tax=Pseudomonas sp. R1-1 TaxID=1602529 RepID=UPI003DA7F588
MSLRRFGSQSRLFDCQTLSLCHRSKSCLFTGQNLRLISACSFGKFSLTLLFSGNPHAFRCQSLRLCGSRLRAVVGLNRGQPVLHVDLLLVEHLDCLRQQAGVMGRSVGGGPGLYCYPARHYRILQGDRFLIKIDQLFVERIAAIKSIGQSRFLLKLCVFSLQQCRANSQFANERVRGWKRMGRTFQPCCCKFKFQRLRQLLGSVLIFLRECSLGRFYRFEISDHQVLWTEIVRAEHAAVRNRR